LKEHVRCVWALFCLAIFSLFLSIPNAFPQGTSLAPSDRVVINMGETPWQFLLNQDPMNTQAPSSDDSSWRTVGVPYSADQMTMFINEESGGGEGELGGGINWYRNHFT
jgi:hypothetical protein